MKKRLLSVAICVICTILPTFAAEGYVFTAADIQKTPVFSQSLQQKNLIYGEYLKYYNLNPAKIDADFIVLSKDEEKKFLKTLTKTEKENYEYARMYRDEIKRREEEEKD